MTMTKFNVGDLVNFVDCKTDEIDISNAYKVIEVIEGCRSLHGGYVVENLFSGMRSVSVSRLSPLNMADFKHMLEARERRARILLSNIEKLKIEYQFGDTVTPNNKNREIEPEV